MSSIPTGRSFTSRRPFPPLRAKSGGDAFENIQSKFNSFVKEATPKVEEAMDEVRRSAVRTYQRLDTEYEFTERTEKATKRLKEAVVDVDQTYGLKRRLRRATEWISRQWPVWNRWFEEFTSTQAGKFVVIAGCVLLMTTSFFWQLVNWLLLIWWIAIPVLTLVGIQRAQRLAQEQAAAMEAERERQRDPLGSMFRDAARGVKNAADRVGGGGKKGGSSRPSKQSEGPVIDAEWRPLDDSR